MRREEPQQKPPIPKSPFESGSIGRELRWKRVRGIPLKGNDEPCWIAFDGDQEAATIIASGWFLQASLGLMIGDRLLTFRQPETKLAIGQWDGGPGSEVVITMGGYQSVSGAKATYTLAPMLQVDGIEFSISYLPEFDLFLNGELRLTKSFATWKDAELKQGFEWTTRLENRTGWTEVETLLLALPHLLRVSQFSLFRTDYDDQNLGIRRP